MKNKNVLIINYFGTQNKGDIAIIIGMLESLKRIGCRLSILSHDTDITARHLRGYEIDVVKNLIDRNDGRNTLLWITSVTWQIVKCMCWISLKILGINIKFLFDKRTRLFVEAYENADTILSSGGGYIHDSRGPIIIFAFFNIYIGYLLKKRVILYSQSIGPIRNKIYRYIAKFVLNRVYMILVREEISKDVLDKLGVYKPVVYITADPAFIYKEMNDGDIQKLLHKENILENNSRILVGITVRHWHYPVCSDPISKFESYKRSIANVCDYIIEKLDATVVFVPMVVMVNEDERDTAKGIIEYVKYKDRTKIITEDYSSVELRYIIGKMDMLIGTRFHSIIFAVTMNVPVVAIAYEHKAFGIMRMLNLEQFVCDINDLRTDELILKINNVLNNKNEIKNELRSKIDVLQERALLTAELIK